jgi:hypothetical protein
LEEEIVSNIGNIGTANQTDFWCFCICCDGEIELLSDFSSRFIGNGEGDGVEAQLCCSRCPTEAT